MRTAKLFLTLAVTLFAFSFSYAQQEQLYALSVTVKNNDSLAAHTEANQKLVEKFSSLIYNDIVNNKQYTKEDFALEANKNRALSLIGSELHVNVDDAKWTGKKCTMKGSVSTDIYLLAKQVEKRLAEPESPAQNGGAAVITAVSTNEPAEQPAAEEKTELTEQEMIAASNYLKEGMAAHAQKNYNEAIRNYQLAVEIDATSAEPFFKMGNAFYELNRYDEAITSYEKALALQPDYTDVLFNLGNSYLEKGNYPKAINAYERVLASDPKNADAYYYMGAALFQNGDQQNAVIAFQNAARNGSRDAQKWLSANKLTW